MKLLVFESHRETDSTLSLCQLRLKKARSVVVAPNIQDVDLAGGLNDEVRELRQLCDTNSVPIIFALNRRKLGKIYGTHKAMSAIAILDFSGANERHAEMLALARQGREQWAPLTRCDRSHSGILCHQLHIG